MGLITTIEQFREYIPVNKNTFSLSSIQPDMDLVEEDRIKPLVGRAFFYQMESKVKAGDELTAAETSVLRLLRLAVATLAMVSYLPAGQLQITDMGVTVTQTTDQKNPAQWQMNQFRANLQGKGYNALEKALTLLDEHIDAPEFAAWATSAAATASHKFFLNTASAFSEHYNIGSSRLTYLALLPTLRKMERFSLEPVLGSEYYLELKEQIMDRDLSADNVRVLDQFVRPALAHLVVAKAVPEIGLGLNGDAIELNVYRLDDANQKEADASLDSLLAMKVEQALADANVYLERLKKYLNANASATKYATYFASSVYQSPTAPRAVVRTAPDGAVYGWL
ncbi:DUF6712 family protein [Hymenobacter psychrotolerans]|uniref:Uncharacterized protein n=1 Tax=Hymenobacter psychrotolerans DSM 18569 TaxID=1121959 RepID=A0A1M6Z7V1_9BACT|nr:DUF6712 family protein [Hymenobacter psychrotolerans]SHL26399.1 hypothetical protein SAMN02746009_02446 [Hymenobacter psychrotolerans DSM 18569]